MTIKQENRLKLTFKSSRVPHTARRWAVGRGADAHLAPLRHPDVRRGDWRRLELPGERHFHLHGQLDLGAERGAPGVRDPAQVVCGDAVRPAPQ